jgi:hypothetical protein
LTADDFALLAIGLLMGIAIGATLTRLMPSYPRPAREVRVTVARDAVPRRAATLSGDPFDGPREPASGGPADPRAAPAPTGALPAASRTPVHSPAAGSLSLAGAASGPTQRLVAVPMGSGVDPLVDVLRGRRQALATAVLEPEVSHQERRPAFRLDQRPAARSLMTPPANGPTGDPTPARSSGPSASADPADDPDTGTGTSGPCEDLRRIADERCEVATRARAEAERAHDTLRAAQRSYDDNLAHAEEAARAADPRTVRSAKDAAQQTFRVTRANAATAEAVDAAARDWLQEINRINRDTRTATAAAANAQETARALAGSLERLSVEADAARIAAASADEACLGARQALSDCEEAANPDPADAAQPAIHSGEPGGPWIDDSIAAIDASGSSGAPSALETGTAPTIFRLLQGDHAALIDVVARLAGDDPEQRRSWQLAMSDLVDAILATAIEGAALEFPEDDPFWGPFTVGQSREIVGALASLGYRYDGLGGWQDGRIPSQRDLSLALGYAGLDPMRMRHWPTETEMFELFSRIRVAAPEYLAESAGDLTLGELVTLLGRRAEGLADVWNAWGRIRPLLLEER